MPLSHSSCLQPALQERRSVHEEQRVLLCAGIHRAAVREKSVFDLFLSVVFTPSYSENVEVESRREFLGIFLGRRV